MSQDPVEQSPGQVAGDAGQQTRARLMDAALELIADGGQEAVRVRRIADMAGVNTAAIGYHFGSLASLCRVAIERAQEQHLELQYVELQSLKPNPTLEQVVSAFARPTVSALSAGGPTLVVVKSIARASMESGDPPLFRQPGFARNHLATASLLTRQIPELRFVELLFRVRCVGGLLRWLAVAPLGASLMAQPEMAIERTIVPMLVGMLRTQSAT